MYGKKHILINTNSSHNNKKLLLKISITELAKNKRSLLILRVSSQKMLIMGEITRLFTCLCPYFNKTSVVFCEPRNLVYDCKSKLAECSH